MLQYYLLSYREREYIKTEEEDNEKDDHDDKNIHS